MLCAAPKGPIASLGVQQGTEDLTWGKESLKRSEGHMSGISGVHTMSSLLIKSLY